jgi:hypothetical protein
MARVVPHAGLSFDDPRDTRKRPEIGVESVGLRSPEEGSFYTLLLHGSQTATPSRASRTPPGASSSLFPCLEPSAHTLPADPQLSRDVRLSLALAEEPRCPLPAVLKLVKVRGITESCGWRDGKERRIILEVESNNGKSRKGYATWNRVHPRPSVCQSGRVMF